MKDLIAGFDANRPLPRTMYVARKPDGVNAARTVSRLNCMYPSTKGRRVLDSARGEFCWETILFLEETDPNLPGIGSNPDGETHGIVDFVRIGGAVDERI